MTTHRLTADGRNKLPRAVYSVLVIAALIAIAGVTAFKSLGSQIATTMNNAASKMKTS